jgi:hypothetical protein
LLTSSRRKQEVTIPTEMHIKLSDYTNSLSLKREMPPFKKYKKMSGSCLLLRLETFSKLTFLVKTKLMNLYKPLSKRW